MADHWRDFDVHYAKTIELKMIAKWGLMKWITRVVATLRKLPFTQMMCLDCGQNIWGIWRLSSIVCTPNIFELLTCWPLFSRPQAETNKSSFSGEQFSFDILNLNMNRLIQVSRSQEIDVSKDVLWQRLIQASDHCKGKLPGLFVIWNAY